MMLAMPFRKDANTREKNYEKKIEPTLTGNGDEKKPALAPLIVFYLGFLPGFVFSKRCRGGMSGTCSLSCSLSRCIGKCFTVC